MLNLDSLSSYIVINNVTNDKELLLTYYKYRIEELKPSAENKSVGA